MNTVIWHNPHCSKSYETMKLLLDKGIDLVIRYYLDKPPTREELEHVLTMLDMSPYQLMRRSEPVLNGKDVKDGDPDLIDLMLKHPEVIQRPIVIKDGINAELGRPPKKVLALFPEHE